MHRNNRHCEIRGVWSVGEHERFIEAMTLYPCGPWRHIADHVGSRSIKQVQTHAQKYQQKLMRHQRGLRKRKTKLKRPEHRVDETTLDQFAGHKCIVRYAQRLVKEIEEDADADDHGSIKFLSLPLPESPVDAAAFVGFNLAGVTFEQWTSLTRDTAMDTELLDLVTDGSCGQPSNQKTKTTSGGKDNHGDEEEDDFPQFEFMYDPPKDWNEWQLEDLLQPTETNATLDTDKGGHPDGSELPLLECTV